MHILRSDQVARIKTPPPTVTTPPPFSPPLPPPRRPTGNARKTPARSCKHMRAHHQIKSSFFVPFWGAGDHGAGRREHTSHRGRLPRRARSRLRPSPRLSGSPTPASRRATAPRRRRGSPGSPARSTLQHLLHLLPPSHRKEQMNRRMLTLHARFAMGEMASR